MSEYDPVELERARKLFAGPCDFIAGAQNTGVFPDSSLPEIAFAGRSNVGKSSLINALTGRKSLARVSQTPGRTQQINFFKLGEGSMLVDLPGYGFAKVSKALAAQWQQLIMDYLRGRPNLRRVILLIDARRGVMDTDLEVMALLDQAAVSYLVVLTKIDTLKPAEQAQAHENALASTKGHAAAYPEIIGTSALGADGLDVLRAHIAALAER